MDNEHDSDPRTRLMNLTFLDKLIGLLKLKFHVFRNEVFFLSKLIPKKYVYFRGKS